MVDLKLVAYIKKGLKQGISIKTIKSQLNKSGWKDKDIKEAFQSAISSETPKTEPPTPKTYCWKCGTENDATAQNCKHCGVNLKEVPEEKKEEVVQKKEPTKIDISEEIRKGLVKKEQFETMRGVFGFAGFILGGIIVYSFKIKFFSWTTLIIMLGLGVLGIGFGEYLYKTSKKAEELTKKEAEGVIQPEERKKVTKGAIISSIVIIACVIFIFYSCSSPSTGTPPTKKDFCSSIIPDRIKLDDDYGLIQGEMYYWKDGIPMETVGGWQLGDSGISDFHKGRDEGENINYLYRMYYPYDGHKTSAFYYYKQPILETGEVSKKISWAFLLILDSNDLTDEGYKVVQYKCRETGGFYEVGASPLMSL